MFFLKKRFKCYKNIEIIKRYTGEEKEKTEIGPLFKLNESMIRTILKKDVDKNIKRGASFFSIIQSTWNSKMIEIERL